MLVGPMGENGSSPAGNDVIRACAATLEALVTEEVLHAHVAGRDNGRGEVDDQEHEQGKDTDHKLTAKFNNACTKAGEDFKIEDVEIDVLKFQ